MKKTIIFAILFLSAIAAGAETIINQEIVKGKTTRHSAEIKRITEGSLNWEIITGTDSVSKTGTSADGKLMAVESIGPDQNITLKVEGDTLICSGTNKGTPFSGTLELKGRLWALGFNWPLKTYVQNGKKGPMPFLMINPLDMEKSTDMVLTPEKQETVEGKQAMRFKVGLGGAMALFWSAKLWADPVTGNQVKYQGNQGPGTPDMVVLTEYLP